MMEYNKKRLWTVMYGLLYPAVLGTFFFSLLPAALESLEAGFHRELPINTRLLISILIVLHFILDYMFAGEVKEYRLLAFIFDLAIVACLFLAYDAVELAKQSGELNVSRIAFWMALTYVSFLGWEYFMKDAIGGVHKKLIVFEVSAATGFIIVASLLDLEILLVVILTLATLGMILICGDIQKKYHRNKQAQSVSGSGRA